SNLHPVDQILTNIVAEAIPSDSQLIAGRVMEQVDVPERSGTLLVEETRSFMGAPEADSRRAPGASRQSLSSFNRSSLTFKAEIHSFEDSIAMEDIEDSQYPGSEEERSARKVRRALLLAQEKRCADLLFSTSEFTNNTSPSTKFDAAGAEPLSFLHNELDTLRAANHGIVADTMILGYDVFRALARNPEIRSFVGDSSAGIASGNRILADDAVIEVLRSVLNIANVFVGSARRETAIPGATSSEADIWQRETIGLYIMRGSDAVAQKSGGVKAMPVAALNMVYKGLQAGQYDSLDLVRRHVWGEHVQLFKKVDSDRGRLLTNCLST
ncbi:MAG: hypothetical protein ACO39F_03795, partial [Candidatus Nanopelagicaceae bacterium]